MSPRLCLASIAAVSLATLATLGGCRDADHPPARLSPPRNVVLVVADALRADHLPTYGYARDTAPFLAGLAREGLALDGYSASSWTRPAVATLLTGLEPQRHQAVTRADVLPPSASYLPALLADAGFATAGWVANLNVGRRWGFDRGFAQFGQARGHRKVDGTKVTAGVSAFLPQLAPPFFLYAHYVDPHDPYRPDEPWLAADVAGTPPLARWPYLQPQALSRNGAALDEVSLDRLTRQYDGEVRAFDRELARLLAALDRQGLLANTLVVVTADHGEELGDHGGLTHGHTLYEEVVHVPLVIWSRDWRATLASQSRTRAIFRHLDLTPTLLAALGVALPPGLDGRARWEELASGRLVPPGDLYLHLDLDGAAALGLRRGTQKVVEAAPLGGLLFDLATDPGEQIPLPASNGSALRADLIRHHNELSTRPLGRQEATLDDETRAQLQALGYVGADTSAEDLRLRAIPDRLHPRRGLATAPARSPPG